MALNVITALLLCAAPTQAAPRQEVSLNGPWEYVVVDDLTSPPAGATWQPIAVPGYLHGIESKGAWLRRSFDVPRLGAGARLKLHFNGVKYNSRVLVNGRRVGGCFGGYDAFDVDVTDAVRQGQSNELVVGIHDWTGVFTPGKVSFADASDWQKVRGTPGDKVLAPIGGLFALYGIWDDVTLVAHPAVYVKDLFVKTSVRRGELAIDYVLANESAVDREIDLSAAVEDAGQEVLRLAPVKAKVPAGKTVAVTLRQPWKSPHLWSHADPHLYHLRSRLTSGDALRTRFGFREFWTAGSDFYLNGAKVNLLATSWWPPHAPAPREQIAKDWQAVKRAGCVAFRTHTQPWRDMYYELADEIGLMMVPEGAIWNDRDVYRINDPAFWENYGQHLRAMVGRLKNHPSIVMWSLENEFYGGRLNDEAPAKAELVRMGRLVKECDPTRPILYESDGDPGGVADVIGMHYPHEYPDYTCWPNEAYWLDRAQAPPVGMFLNGDKKFLWRRNKPLYIGEFLWIPSSDPSWNSVFFGDRAYIDYHRYQNLAKAEVWKMQVLGYRHQGVGGISPWTMVEGGPLDETNPLYQAHAYAYQHLAAYCHDYDRRFYSGTRAMRRVEVYNDILDSSALTFAWTLDVEGKPVDRGSLDVALGPGEKKTLQVELAMPAVSKPTPARWRLTLVRGVKTVFEDHHQYTVHPPLRLGADPAPAIGIYDPRGKAKTLFQEHSLAFIDVAALDAIDGRIDVLVIGPGAFAATQGPVAIGEEPSEQAGIEAFLARGGRLLVLEQEAWPAGLLGLQLTTQKSTMTFPLRPSHPALAGVADEDLKFWRGDHMVAAHEPLRPMSGAARAIVVSGSGAGIDHAPLLELPAGKGLAVLCQLKLVEKCRTEPAAGRILANLLGHLARCRPAPPGKTLVLGGSPEYHACLRSLGLRFGHAPDAGKADLSGFGLVICRGDAPADAAELGRRLRTFVESGGRVLLHRPEPTQGQRILTSMGLDLRLEPGPATLVRAEGTGPIFQAFTREDLYWLARRVEGWTGQASPRCPDMCDGLLGRTLDEKRAQSYPLGDWKLQGALVQRQGNGVGFATNGTATGEVEFPADGVYTLGFVASGTPCQNVFPVAGVSVDGEPLGTVRLQGPRPATYTVWGPVSRGRHKVSIAFLNDASIPGKEDRNLVVERLLVARNESADVTALTRPAAVVAVRRGKGLVVVDLLRWDTVAADAGKATRYASSLLGELGGDLVCRSGVTLKCAEMTPQKNVSLIARHGGRMVLACNGYITQTVRVAAAGRYTMETFAGGSPAKGEYPLVEVSLDGKLVARIQTTSSDCRPYPVPAELTQGQHELKLTFVNDLCADGEDRNLYLDKVVWYRRSTD
jgi:hypothetical protein